MSGCPSFKISVNGDLNSILNHVKQEASQKGIAFSGDTSGGSFSGMGIVGTYSVSGNQVTVNISQKPLIAPCSYIESELRKYFNG